MPSPTPLPIHVTRETGKHQHYQGTSGNDLFVQRAEDFVAAAKAVQDGASPKSQYNVILGGEGDADTYQIVHNLKGEFPRQKLQISVTDKGVVVLRSETGVAVASLARDMEYLEVRTGTRNPSASNAIMILDGTIRRIHLDDIRNRMAGTTGTLSIGNDGALLIPSIYSNPMPMDTIQPTRNRITSR